MSVGIRALAVEFPSAVRTNDYWRRRHPEIFKSAEERTLARMWATGSGGSAGTDLFDDEMRPYLRDTFRGTVERRVLAPGETVLSVEAKAARSAMAAARLSPQDVSLLICCTFVPDHVGIGHAAFLAQELGLRGSAWNMETACNSSLEALRVAAAMVRAGEHDTVLVVSSCMYSKVSDETDTLTWFLGDGASAFVVGRDERAAEVLGAYSHHSGETCGAIYYELSDDPATPRVCVRADRASGQILRDTSARYLRENVHGALKKAKVALEDVAFFAVNTPTAWFASFCARALGVPAERTLSTYAEYANIGPVLMPANLHRAATTGRLSPGDHVVLYSVGSVSSVGALVVRWGDVAVGVGPSKPTLVQDGRPTT